MQENQSTVNSFSKPNNRIVLNIMRMTIHNGPGIRTVVFFKGCPLRCLWCSTPESNNANPEIAIYPKNCIHCDRCVDVCPHEAILLTEETISIERALCDNCGECTLTCNARALVLLGKSMTIAEIIQEVKKDLVFFKHSQGGVTLSGGEPLLNPEFNLRLLRTLKEEEISIGIDTCGFVPWRCIDPILPYTDFFLWDIKVMNPETHKKLTGVRNELILENVLKVSERKIPIYIRVPVIPGYNDSEENIKATCEFARDLSSLVEVSLIPLHHLGKAKYESLDRAYSIDTLPLIPDSVLQEMKQLVGSYGLNCTVNA
ncbi:glycyl-radical enzyme activating protein [Thermodesulfobacteriota bacterium]